MARAKRQETPAEPSVLTQPSPPAEPVTVEKRNRPQVRQEDVPSYSLEDALRVPVALAESYAFKPTRPLNVAQAMKMTPTSGRFRMLAGAALAYGLTTGGAYAPEIGLTPLGLRAVRPTAPDDDLAAKREALLKPKVVGDFLRQYDGAALPADAIAKNVLLDKGVPRERVDDVLALIVGGAESVGFLKEIQGRRYVDLVATGARHAAGESVAGETGAEPPAAPPPALPVGVAPPVGVTVGAGVHVNIEIHIAADASSETIEDIFRNMRRYFLSGNGSAEGE